MSIYDYDNDFAHYELDDNGRKKLGQFWTPYSVIEKLMDKIDKQVWEDPNKTNLDPTMGAGNIIIGMLYRRIVEYKQDPVKALSNVYGVEMDEKTLNYAKERIKKFMEHFCTIDENVNKIIEHNFACSDIFKWDLENWRPLLSEKEKTQKLISKFLSKK